jgi:hypothetical protein
MAPRGVWLEKSPENFLVYIHGEKIWRDEEKVLMNYRYPTR